MTTLPRYRVTKTVKGAMRAIVREYTDRDEAEESAARWRRSNSQGSYVAKVERVR